MAGKTFHDSQVIHVDIIKSLKVTLTGTAGDGGNLDLGMNFDDKSLALTGSSPVSYTHLAMARKPATPIPVRWVKSWKRPAWTSPRTWSASTSSRAARRTSNCNA